MGQFVIEWKLHYHTKLHYSQTAGWALRCRNGLHYHTKLHYSQTVCTGVNRTVELHYHTKLHYSQTQSQYLRDNI